MTVDNPEIVSMKIKTEKLILQVLEDKEFCKN